MARAGSRLRAAVWLARLCELEPLEIRQEQIQRAVEHRRDVAGRHRMPEQVLRATQLLARAFTETPPARNAFDVSQYAELRVDDAGHPEWAVPKGPS